MIVSLIITLEKNKKKQEHTTVLVLCPTDEWRMNCFCAIASVHKTLPVWTNYHNDMVKVMKSKSKQATRKPGNPMNFIISN